jgi:hypothetical protein
MDKETKHQLALIQEVPSLLRDVSPLWLIGGWALDFLLATIRRRHDDIDWLTLFPAKDAILRVLHSSGFRVTHNLGWHTRLTRDAYREYGEVEINFLQKEPSGLFLVVTDDAGGFVRLGKYNLPDNTLDPTHIRELEGIKALVTSPISEFACRVNYAQFRMQPDADEKYEKDTEALRSLLTEREQQEAVTYFVRSPLRDSEQLDAPDKE